MSLALGVLALLSLAGQEAGSGAGDGLPPRKPVAGMHGFRSVSRIVYSARPKSPHLLEVRHQFPARVRWSLRLADGPPNLRVAEYRHGDRAFRILQQRTDSIELAGTDRDRLFARMDLRRAAMLWPDGFSWEDVEVGGDAGKRADLLGPAGDDGAARRLGHVLARDLEDGRPGAFVLHGPDGDEEERLLVHGWRERAGRTWPERLELVVGRRTIWHEDVEAVTGDVWFLDVSFLPPDRRAGHETAAATAEGVQSVDLRPATFRAHELAPDAGWTGWLARAEELADEARRELAPRALEVDATPTFELDAEGRATRCLVRLVRALDDPPPGWTSVGERPGLLVAVDSLEDGLPAGLARLRRSLSSGTPAGVPYVRVYGEDVTPRLQLALPLRPEEGAGSDG